MYTKGAATGLAQTVIDYMASNSTDVQNVRKNNGSLAISYLDPKAKAAKQI